MGEGRRQEVAEREGGWRLRGTGAGRREGRGGAERGGK